MKKRTILLIVYFVLLLLPIYWLVNMSFKTSVEILGSFTLFPRDFTFQNYWTIFTTPAWYTGYINSIKYVVINTVLSLTVALPAAYAFSRYEFTGDKHLFFLAFDQSDVSFRRLSASILSTLLLGGLI